MDAVSSHGIVTEESLPPEGPLQRVRYTWRHDVTAAAGWPAPPPLALEALVARNGERSFVPAAVPEAFALQADLVGHLLREELGELDDEPPFAGHFNRLLVQYSGRVREALCRTIKRPQDLELRSSERVDRSRVDVLPDDLGLEPGGGDAEARWSVKVLVEAGSDRAREMGLTNPDHETVIRLGFLVAAERHPFDVTHWNAADCRGLLRTSLWDLGPATSKIDERTRARVRRRFHELLERHLDDNTGRFNDWFLEGRDGIVRAIEKRKSRGGPIVRELVRQTILEMTIDAYESLAVNVDFVMNDFARALRQPLTEAEQPRFELLYRANEWLGGYPLILLRDRLDFVREAVLLVMESPRDPRVRGVLLRALWFHGETIRRKRESERHYKRTR